MGSVTLEQLHAYAPGFPVIRTMPNTPLAAGAGMTAICCDEAVTEPMKQTAAAIFSSCGEIEFVDEKALQAITAISGCGPGYCFVIIDALADAGVRAGLPRALAIKLAAQTMAGSGKLCVESGLHPAQLRDQVTSPGGTTIAGIHALEIMACAVLFMMRCRQCCKEIRNYRGNNLWQTEKKFCVTLKPAVTNSWRPSCWIWPRAPINRASSV